LFSTRCDVSSLPRQIGGRLDRHQAGVPKTRDNRGNKSARPSIRHLLALRAYYRCPSIRRRFRAYLQALCQDCVTGASLIVMKLIGGYGICSSRTSPRGLKPKRHRCQRAGRVRWCLKGNSMDIITREQAITLGLKKYFDGLPCKHGHISERYVSSGCCAQCTGDGAKGRYRDNADCQEARKRRPHP
jgi:hypothetical protein